jgi:hypothetical protein
MGTRLPGPGLGLDKRVTEERCPFAVLVRYCIQPLFHFLLFREQREALIGVEKEIRARSVIEDSADSVSFVGGGEVDRFVNAAAVREGF